MDKLVRLDRILEEAEERGQDTSEILVNRKAIYCMPSEENPDEVDEGSEEEDS